MKRIALTVALLISVSLIVLGQMGCQPEANTNRSESTAATNTNSGRETVDRASIERELLAIENDWPRVVKEKDVAAVRRVEADDIVLIDPDGNVRDKAQDIKDIESGALSAAAWEVADLKVNVLNNDAAVVSGRAVVKGGKYTMPDGKSVDISGEYRFIDTFAKRAGQWKLVAAASVPVKQPAAASSPAAKASPAMMASPTPRVSPSARTSPTTTRTP